MRRQRDKFRWCLYWENKTLEKHCHCFFSWMNTRHKYEASSLKVTIFKVIPEEKQQLVEETDADNISTLQIIHSVVLRIKIVFLQVPSRLFWFAPVLLLLKWNSRYITKHLISGPWSFVFPRVLMSPSTLGLFIWRPGTPGRVGNMWWVTPPNM